MTKTKAMRVIVQIVTVSLLVTGCRTPGTPAARGNSAAIDHDLAILLSEYESAWRNYRMSGHEGTAREEYRAHQKLLRYIRKFHKTEALRTYILCAPDGPHADEFRAEILRQYLELTQGDRTQFCRSILAKQVLDKTYQYEFRVRAAIFLAERKHKVSLEFALHLLESNMQYTENDGIAIVSSYYDWKGANDIPSEHWDLPDPWADMRNAELAKDIAAYLREELAITPKYAPEQNEESPNKPSGGDVQ